VRFTIDRGRQASGPSHVVEASSDLVNWAPASGFSHTSEFAEPGFRRWHFERTMEPGEQKQFLRLRSELSSVVDESSWDVVSGAEGWHRFRRLSMQGH